MASVEASSSEAGTRLAVGVVTMSPVTRGSSREREQMDATRPASPPLQVTEPPPASGAPFLLGGIGLAAFVMGFLLAVGGRSNFQQLAGLISLVVGSVLLAGGFIVAAIVQLREDLWRDRQRQRR
jgi:hypothetical protein